MAGQGRAVLYPGLLTLAIHGRQVQQAGEAAGPLDQRSDRGPVQADDEIASPVAGNGAVLPLSWPLADHDLGCDELLAPPLRPGPGNPQGAAGAQTGDELPAQGPSALDEQRLVDGLVGDSHGLIIGEIGPQPIGDLLGAPRLGPTAVLAASVASADEEHR